MTKIKLTQCHLEFIFFQRKTYETDMFHFVLIVKGKTLGLIKNLNAGNWHKQSNESRKKGSIMIGFKDS